MSTQVKREFDHLEYENLGFELKSLSALVLALGTDEIAELRDVNVRVGCFNIISDLISDRAEIADALFTEYFEKVD